MFNGLGVALAFIELAVKVAYTHLTWSSVKYKQWSKPPTPLIRVSLETKRVHNYPHVDSTGMTGSIKEKVLSVARFIGFVGKKYRQAAYNLCESWSSGKVLTLLKKCILKIAGKCYSVLWHASRPVTQLCQSQPSNF